MKRRRICLLITIIAMAISGCASQSNTADSTRSTDVSVDGTSDSTSETITETIAVTQPPKEYEWIKDLPEIRIVNMPLSVPEKPEPDITKTAAVIFEAESQVRSPLVIEKDTLYFGDHAGTFYAVRLQDNQSVWTYDAGIPISSKPVITEGKIIFSADNSLFCIDIDTGEELWVYTREVESSYMTIAGYNYDYQESSAVIYGSEAYFASNEGSITAVDIATGEEVWRNDAEIRMAISSGLMIREDKLFYSNIFGSLYILDLKTHKMLYKMNHNDSMYSPMQMEDGIIYFAGRSIQAFAVDADTGKVLWVTKGPSETSWYSGGCVIIGDEVFFGTSDAFLVVVLNKNTGELLRMYRTNMNVFTQSLVYGDQLIVIDCNVYSLDEGSVLSFDTKDENHIFWEVNLADGLISSPVLYGDRVIFGSESGKIYAVDLE